MNSINELLESHLTMYPLMELQDMIKLLYQNEMGPGHMITDEAKSLERLKTEWKALAPVSGSILYESIGNELVRLHLAAVSEEELPVLNHMFCETANYMQGDSKKLLKNLNCLSSFVANNSNFLAEYIASGCPPISHSQVYKETYHPAYRVITKSHACFLELIRTLRALLSKQPEAVIAIDGCCASGKTSLGSLLCTYFDCNVIHMDDFFLPPELRTKKRLAEPGGNIHYERFEAEVVKPLLQHMPIAYRRFHCHTMDYSDLVTLSPKPLTIIEGSYCMRPEFRKAYDYTVFLSCTYEYQLERIQKRNGDIMLQNFIDRWIPMENDYFRFFQVEQACSRIIST